MYVKEKRTKTNKEKTNNSVEKGKEYKQATQRRNINPLDL